ncbi:MAG: GNAT family N-acetyltransferase [Planctomycetota bacterium]
MDHTGRGLGTEAAAALTRIGFEIEKLRRAEIHCDPVNGPSAAIPRKLGYAHQVTVPGWVNTPKATPRDTMIWVMSSTQLPASPAATAEIEAFDASGERVPWSLRYRGAARIYRSRRSAYEMTHVRHRASAPTGREGCSAPKTTHVRHRASAPTGRERCSAPKTTHVRHQASAPTGREGCSAPKTTHVRHQAGVRSEAGWLVK